jgi:hypothetical protein
LRSFEHPCRMLSEWQGYARVAGRILGKVPKLKKCHQQNQNTT